MIGLSAIGSLFILKCHLALMVLQLSVGDEMRLRAVPVPQLRHEPERRISRDPAVQPSLVTFAAAWSQNVISAPRLQCEPGVGRLIPSFAQDPLQRVEHSWRSPVISQLKFPYDRLLAVFVGRNAVAITLEKYVGSAVLFKMVSRLLVGFSCLMQGKQHKYGADEREHRAYYGDARSPVRSIRCFFSSESGAPLGAQVGAIVVLTSIAALLIYVGISGIISRSASVRNHGFILLSGGLGVYFTLAWWTSPCH